ncbi:hypothetical protein QM806_41425, partial [Rhodococcus sp. IEGM 1351]|uniref:hypothetical protein n=1 Tax=Rhodococcus sp. IEGM 1351 TaxID=3047089 RepID=UPI0024B63B49
WTSWGWRRGNWGAGGGCRGVFCFCGVVCVGFFVFLFFVVFMGFGFLLFFFFGLCVLVIYVVFYNFILAK